MSHTAPRPPGFGRGVVGLAVALVTALTGSALAVPAQAAATGLHGTRNLSGALGSAASHGCVRLSTRAITWLAGRIGAGVPLTVTR